MRFAASDAILISLQSVAICIPQLRAELLALNKEIVDQSERYELSRKLMQQENVELVQHISEQKSMLINMANQISKFEKDAVRTPVASSMVCTLLTIYYAQHSFEMVSMRSVSAVDDDASCAPAVSEASSSEPSEATVRELQQSIESLNEQLSHVQSINHKHESANNERMSALQSLQSLHIQSQSTIDELNEQLAAKLANEEKLVSGSRSQMLKVECNAFSFVEEYYPGS